MSTTIFPQRRRSLTAIGLVLVALFASAESSRTQSASAERALLSHGAFDPAGKESRESGHGSDLERDLRSAYFAEFTGNGAEGRDMVWRGAVAGVAVGEMTVLLAHVGRDVDTSNPTWPVEGIIIVSGEDPKRAFAAEMHGTIDWPTQRVKLAGEVSAGYMRGAHIEQTADLIGKNLSGELRLVRTTLAAAQ